MSILLKFKHWQIFFSFIVIPLALLISGAILSKVIGTLIIGELFAALAALCMVLTFYGWIWAIALKLNKYSKDVPVINPLRFKSIFLTTLLTTFIVNPAIKSIFDFDTSTISLFIGLISLVLFIYCIYMASCTLTAYEQKYIKKPHSVLDNTLLIWFMPIGVWLIQPRINQIVSVNNFENIQE